MAAIERQGLTLIELIVCTVIIGILSTTALPITRNVIRKQKEALLIERLSEMRMAIDRYYHKKAAKEPDLEDWRYYPQSLQQLVEERLLRKIPIDPFTENTGWKTRSSTDEATAGMTNTINVFDVYSATAESDLKGKPYCEW